jgi:lipoate-protein ligase A
LRAAGPQVVRRGTSDLAVCAGGDERKVSGNALRVRRRACLYHGTMLDRFDLTLVERLLRHPPREPEYRGGRPHRAFLANLGLGRPAIEAAVRRAFGATAVRHEWPQAAVARLFTERYSDPAWVGRLG